MLDPETVKKIGIYGGKKKFRKAMIKDGLDPDILPVALGGKRALEEMTAVPIALDGGGEEAKDDDKGGDENENGDGEVPAASALSPEEAEAPASGAATPPPANGSDTPIRTGYMVKEAGRFPHQWQRRWFTLTKHALTYHVTDARAKRKGAVLIGDDVEARVCTDAAKGPHAWEMDAHDGSRVYFFRCSDADERDTWIDAVQRVVEEFRKE